jgi:hypothetical protein
MAIFAMREQPQRQIEMGRGSELRLDKDEASHDGIFPEVNRARDDGGDRKVSIFDPRESRLEVLQCRAGFKFDDRTLDPSIVGIDWNR